MKKKLLFYLLLSCFAINAQQQEHLTQYQFNQFAFNPALAVSKSCIDIRGGYSLQWVGIEGAPETCFFFVPTLRHGVHQKKTRCFLNVFPKIHAVV